MKFKDETNKQKQKNPQTNMPILSTKGSDTLQTQTLRERLAHTIIFHHFIPGNKNSAGCPTTCHRQHVFRIHLSNKLMFLFWRLFEWIFLPLVSISAGIFTHTLFTSLEVLSSLCKVNHIELLLRQFSQVHLIFHVLNFQFIFEACFKSIESWGTWTASQW